MVGVAAVLGLLGGGYWALHSPLDAQLAQWLWRRQDYNLAYHLNYANEQVALDEGSYYFGNGQYDPARAAVAYELALRLHPGVLWGHYQLGRIAFVQGHFADALKELNAEMQANPGNLRALYERGLVYLYRGEKGDLARSQADFTRFIAWAPTEWGGYNDLAYVLTKEEQYAKAESVITSAMQHVPNAQGVPWLWNSLGLAQLNERHYADAVDSFTRALALAKKVTPQEWNRAYSANDPSSAQQSIESFQTAIEANIRAARAGAAL